MTKKALSLVAALVLCVGLAAPASASSSDFVIQDGVLARYYGSDPVVTIPDNVTEIGDYAFYYTKTTAVVIPEGVTTIGKLAFTHCELTSVTIPDSVTTIGERAFFECPNLSSVTIGSGVTSIGSNAFSNCYNLTSVQLGAGVTEIGEWAFACAGLTSVTLPNSVKTIGMGAFAGCPKLTSVVFGNGLTEIGEQAFMSSGLTSVTIPGALTQMGAHAFQDCPNLTSVVIQEGLTEISAYAFDYCVNLSSVTIPASVTAIGEGVFKDCPVTLYGTAGSYAETYAKENRIPFLVPGAPAPVISTAYANPQTVLVNDKPVQFQTYVLRDDDGGEVNYVRLRDVACILNGTTAQFAVSWDSATGNINLLSGQAYTATGGELTSPFSGDQPYGSSTAAVLVNGQIKSLDGITLTDGNGGEYNYYKLRDLGQALSFNVSWINDQVVVNTNQPYSDAQ